MEKNLNNFLEWLLSKGLSDRTIMEYGRYYGLFPHDVEPLQEGVLRFITNYNNNVARAFVKTYLDWSERYDVRVPKVSGRTKKRVIKTLSLSDAETLRRALYMDNAMYGVMFDLQMAGGLRRDELIRIRVEDFIDLEKWMEDEREVCKLKIYGKGNRERIVLISPSVMKKVFEWIKYVVQVQDSEKLFNISEWSYWHHVSRAGKEFLGERVYPHLIRHSKASQLKQDGFDLVDIKNFLGHADISTTQLYIHESEEQTMKKFKDYIKEKELGEV